jgi:hypothetical protein
VPFPTSRQDLVAGIVDDVRNSHKARKTGPARQLEAGLAAARMAPVSAPVRAARTYGVENPFASFYETRRKVSIRAMLDDTADPSSSITRAYIVPEALLAVARGEREQLLGAATDDGAALVRFVATDSSDIATESTNMSRFRPAKLGFVEEWRALQRIALQVAGWLRRVLRRPIPD